jgi:phage protein D
MPAIPTFYAIQVANVPLPRRYLDALAEIEVETSTERASIFRLRFDLSQTPRGQWDLLQFDLFRPEIAVRISVNLGRRPEVLVNGYVDQSQLDNRNEPGQSTLEVVGTDATRALMSVSQEPQRWPNTPDFAIAAKIFGKYSIVPKTDPTSPTRTVVQTTTVQECSDVLFLKSLAKRNGFECFVQPHPLAGMDLGHFHAARLSAPPQAVLSVNFGAATNMQGFHVQYEMLDATSAEAAFVDPRTKAIRKTSAPAATERPMGREPVLLRTVKKKPKIWLVDTLAANLAELQSLGRSVVNRSSRAIRGSGQVDGLKLGRVVRPGLPVLVRGAGRDHSGSYYVTEVHHTLSRDGHRQQIDGWRNAVGLTGTEIFVDVSAALS